MLRLRNQSAESLDTSLYFNDDDSDLTSMTAVGVTVNCDACGARPLDFHWHCNVCEYGNEDLCPPCFKKGSCGHPMFGRFVRNGRIVHRCGRKQCYFEGPTRESLEVHYLESSIHGVCLKCWPRPDFGSKNGLLNHWRTSPEHHWCDHCEKDFDSEHNLHQHRKTQRLREISCFGCPRFFPSYSAMMIHLESGNCSCGTNEMQLRQLAVHCFQYKHYVVPGMEYYLRNSRERPEAGPEHLNYYDQCYECPDCDRRFDMIAGLQRHLLSPVHDEPAFRCPGAECGMTFNCISGLLQHVESDRCEESLDYRVGSIGKMLHYIHNKLK